MDNATLIAERLSDDVRRALIAAFTEAADDDPVASAEAALADALLSVQTRSLELRRECPRWPWNQIRKRAMADVADEAAGITRDPIPPPEP